MTPLGFMAHPRWAGTPFYAFALSAEYTAILKKLFGRVPSSYDRWPKKRLARSRNPVRAMYFGRVTQPDSTTYGCAVVVIVSRSASARTAVLATFATATRGAVVIQARNAQLLAEP